LEAHLTIYDSSTDCFSADQVEYHCSTELKIIVRHFFLSIFIKRLTVYPLPLLLY